MGMKLIAGLVAVIAVGAVGCGDDEDESGVTATAALTKEEWIAQANEICRASNKEMEAAAGKFFAAEKGSEEEFQSDVLVPGVSEQVAGVKALGAPEGDEAEIEEIIATAEEGLAQAESDPAVVDSDSGPLAEAGRLIVEYGATGCG